MWAAENEFLEKTDKLIKERLMPIESEVLVGPGENILQLACRHLCVSDHAKRARPLLCLYYHWMLNKNVSDDFTKISVAAEFIHAASLLHDDIIDDAEIRRGRVSANRQFGNATAVLAGDYLLTESFDLLRNFDRKLIDRAIQVVREMTKAASLELLARGNLNLSVEHMQNIAKGKTGILFSWCGFATGLVCGNLEAANRLWSVGERIGLIFQMADDVRDFDGDKNLKDVCRDIRNFEPSVPVLLATIADATIKQKFKEAFSRQHMDDDVLCSLKESVIESGAIIKTKQLMLRELDQVMTDLSVYNGTKGKACFDAWVARLMATEA